MPKIRIEDYEVEKSRPQSRREKMDARKKIKKMK